MPELYDHILSDRCYTVRLLLGLLDVSYTRKTVDYAPAKRPPSPGVVAVNPAGDIPVLVDDGRAYTDLTAILVYLAGHYDPARTWLPQDGADVLRWLGFAAGPLVVLHEARKVLLFAATGDREALVREGRAALRVIEDNLTDQSLAGRDWMAGSAPSLADVAVFPPVMLSHDCGIGHEDYPAINLWQRRVRRLTGFVSTPGIPDYF